MQKNADNNADDIDKHGYNSPIKRKCFWYLIFIHKIFTPIGQGISCKGCGLSNPWLKNAFFLAQYCTRLFSVDTRDVDNTLVHRNYSTRANAYILQQRPFCVWTGCFRINMKGRRFQPENKNLM